MYGCCLWNRVDLNKLKRSCLRKAHEFMSICCLIQNRKIMSYYEDLFIAQFYLFPQAKEYFVLIKGWHCAVVHEQYLKDLWRVYVLISFLINTRCRMLNMLLMFYCSNVFCLSVLLHPILLLGVDVCRMLGWLSTFSSSKGF